MLKHIAETGRVDLRCNRLQGVNHFVARQLQRVIVQLLDVTTSHGRMTSRLLTKMGVVTVSNISHC